MNNRFQIKQIEASELNHFLDLYKPDFDYKKVNEIFEDTLELCFDQDDVLSTNVIHACYDTKEEKYCAILNIGTTTAIDDLVSINVEFLFIEKAYRNIKFKELNDIKLSKSLLVDYIASNIGTRIKSEIGINIISITPINEKVRRTYEEMNFMTIDGSGSKKEEDWMIYYI